MTDAEFMALALSLPESELSSHFGQPDVRVRGKIFVSSGGNREGRKVLKLTVEQQEMMCAAEPAIFSPVTGAWGKKGWTYFATAAADEATASSALWASWRNVAPKTLIKQFA